MFGSRVGELDKFIYHQLLRCLHFTLRPGALNVKGAPCQPGEARPETYTLPGRRKRSYASVRGPLVIHRFRRRFAIRLAVGRGVKRAVVPGTYSFARHAWVLFGRPTLGTPHADSP